MKHPLLNYASSIKKISDIKYPEGFITEDTPALNFCRTTSFSFLPMLLQNHFLYNN
ncbi:MAG: hypothetical protein H7329_16760 [Opitutaceae bacterium]|nr:hypothetical protein [Cytophagales bacterium]